MALSSAQIIARACKIAKVPGYTVQAGQYLNLILQSLCQDYDLDITKKTQTITFGTNALVNPNLLPGASYALNSDSLRTKEVFYYMDGIPFYLFQIPIETYNGLSQPPGSANYPDRYAVDVSTTPHTIFFYPAPSITPPCTIRYYPQMPDISSPETSNTPPWFLKQEYLIKKIAAMLMQDTDDERQPLFDKQAEDILSKYLQMDDDKEGFSPTVKLSRETFRKMAATNPNKAFPFGGR